MFYIVIIYSVERGVPKTKTSCQPNNTEAPGLKIDFKMLLFCWKIYLELVIRELICKFISSTMDFNLIQIWILATCLIICRNFNIWIHQELIFISKNVIFNAILEDCPTFKCDLWFLIKGGYNENSCE